MSNELRYFGTDEYKRNFVIFEMNRENAVNVFFFVSAYEDDDENVEWEVSLEPVSRLFSYAEHFDSPYWVKEEGAEEIIEEALKALESEPSIEEKVRKFDEKYSGRPDSWFEEWDETENKMYEEVEKARKESGYWPWTPNANGE